MEIFTVSKHQGDVFSGIPPWEYSENTKAASFLFPRRTRFINYHNDFMKRKFTHNQTCLAGSHACFSKHQERFFLKIQAACKALLLSTFLLVGASLHAATISSAATGNWSASGTAGKIVVENDATGLTAAQLARINFSAYSPGATIRSTGELVPPPCSASFAATLSSAAATIVQVQRLILP